MGMTKMAMTNQARQEQTPGKFKSNARFAQRHRKVASMEERGRNK